MHPDTVTIDTAATPLVFALPNALNHAADDSERSSWNHLLVLRPSELELAVLSTYGKGTPADVWHGRVIQLATIPDGTADLSELQDALEGHAEELRELAALHVVEWDGSNNVGGFTDVDRANEIMEALGETLTNVVDSLPTFWSAADYYSPVTANDVIPPGFTGTAEAFEALADSELEAALPDVHLDRDDVLANLRCAWKLLLADLAEEAAEAIEAAK